MDTYEMKICFMIGELQALLYEIRERRTNHDTIPNKPTREKK